ncbi:SDR family oxidoreductase [Nocardia terpenica]|uniref:SDR family oxidoreductase n=1 Tax=Nocardia terpenica TaxID=455432 RepID=UPI001894E18F|nr:SDR family oxidoreductase [Nocardia terpenica]MBF6059717.1 SDR family oxidoreductase [Nocardia terpenica]MBF6102742.1 SDR family oxidoreductase [Nocardia terpenica]MBF6111067.1 SDR family oxidoreductase [Nocardia terpenica]MBF6117198.1 SDR family oxidoreductase [Nocardia terpenica]MBF6150961.1 SDR family oxidoreductase [Nocardia terpenica]
MTIAITGSASGIGAAAARTLSEAGHGIVGVDLRDAEVLADLSTPQGRVAAVDGVLDRCGGVLDGVVLCAGIGPHTPDPLRVIELNYRGSVAVLDGLLPALRKGESPAAVVVSSVASTQVTWAENPIADGSQAQALARAGEYAGHMAYAYSKNALTVAVRQRAAEWGAAGVRLNTVAPGTVDTPLLRAGLDDPRYGDLIRGFAAPIPRTAEPVEIAALIAYLLGPQAGYIHGAQFVIDGGVDALIRPTAF